MAAVNPVVDLALDGEVAVVTINSPSVNALSQPVRDGLKRAVESAGADPAASAIVLLCAGRTFIAGADISEFGKPPAPPDLIAALDSIENAPKPVIAALHGTALGGGFEVALAAHYRIAVPSAKCGLPEIKLGIIPGAGGTQRLPRLIGPEKALDVILSGTPFSAREAKEWGVVDELAEEGKLRDAALAFARKAHRRQGALAQGAGSGRQDRAGAGPPRDFRGDPQGERAQVSRLRGVGESDRSSVRNAVELPFDQGMAKERELFAGARALDAIEGAALCLFRRAGGGQGSRPCARRADPPDRQRRRDRRRYDGRRHRHEFPQRGHSRHDDRDREEALDRGVATIRRNYEATAKKGRLTMAEVEERMAAVDADARLQRAWRRRPRDRGGLTRTWA